jgi:hypothetical protein
MKIVHETTYKKWAQENHNSFVHSFNIFHGYYTAGGVTRKRRLGGREKMVVRPSSGLRQQWGSRQSIEDIFKIFSSLPLHSGASDFPKAL